MSQEHAFRADMHMLHTEMLHTEKLQSNTMQGLLYFVTGQAVCLAAQTLGIGPPYGAVH